MQSSHWINTVHHDGSELYVSALTPRFGETVRLRLRVGDCAPVRCVYVRTFPDGEQALTPMECTAGQSPACWYEADLVINQPVVHYRFLIQAADGIWWYTAAGPITHDPLDHTDFRIVADYHFPEWLYEAVFYQIFPDSFANGDPTSDPQPHEYVYHGKRPVTLDWGAELPPDQHPGLAFYGGDLQGIAQKLDHVQRLGANALYLNPIFTSYSVHRYDVIDYDHVDPHLGGDEALIALRSALDARAMHCILDMVPNHCGSAHPWFTAAQADPDAPEAEFFTFDDHPDDYASWLGHKTLPKLNFQSVELRRRMYGNDDAIFRRWLREPFRMDGWRVDVGNMLGRQGPVQLNGDILRGIRQAVKETRPDAYLIGENFYESSAQLQGDQWDGVMNYQGLTLPLWHWLRGYRNWAMGLDEQITSPVTYPTASLVTTWRQHRAAIPWVVTLQQYNQLDSHDTPRIRSIVDGNDALHRLAAVVQMTLPGVPSIYYGDEIGMTDDTTRPHDRARGAMIWDESRWERDLFAFYQQLIALRKQSRILHRGGLQMLAVEHNMFAYQRESRDGRLIVVAQRSPTPRSAGPISATRGGIPEGTRFREFFSGQTATVENGALNLPELAQGATIWIAEG